MAPLEVTDPPPVRRSFIPSLLMLAILGLMLWQLYGPERVHDEDATPRTIEPRGDFTSWEESVMALFERASPSVVHVRNVALVRNRLTLETMAIQRGEGTGFIWDEDGYVVTNFHVVEGGQKFDVTLADGQTVEGKVVGTAPDHDLAVLKIEGVDAAQRPPLAVGSSDKLRVGQAVLAIGNPFGLDSTLTTGVISGLGRVIRSKTQRQIRDVIQTDAAINPGNSGGPLLDSAGRVIGVNTAIVSPSGAYAGVGFAIPIDTVNRIVPILIRGETPERIGLGIELLSTHLIRGLQGVVIADVLPGGSAEKAGLRGTTRDERTGRVQLGDVIVGVGDYPVRTRLDLFDAIGHYEAGDEVTVRVRRGRSEESVPVVLQPLR